MIFKQCENGHYYDPEKSVTCPWCDKNAGAADRQLFNQGNITEPYNYNRDPVYTEPDTIPDTSAMTDFVEGPEEGPDTGEKTEPVTGWLVAMTGPHRGQDFRLVRERNFLGRSADNQICLSNDPEVSRNNHCSVIYDPRSEKFVALAGNSTDTKLNNETLLSSAQLHDGDILSVGKTDLCFISFCREGRNWK